MKTVLLDMYGVIIKESKGAFIPYTFSHFPPSEHERLHHLFYIEKLFTKAGNGEMNSHEFLTALGFSDTEYHMKDYIENYLTIDEGFYRFAERYKEKYCFALLSNDVLDWSRHITKYYHLDQYLPVKIISADVHCRKPDSSIFHIALQRMHSTAMDCILIDNRVENLHTAEVLGMEAILFNRDLVQYDGKIAYKFDDLSQFL